jgi:hypothetical protein
VKLLEHACATREGGKSAEKVAIVDFAEVVIDSRRLFPRVALATCSWFAFVSSLSLKIAFSWWPKSNLLHPRKSSGGRDERRKKHFAKNAKTLTEYGRLDQINAR